MVILIYDGDCGFCTSTAAWVRKRVSTDVRIEPWQKLDLCDFGITAPQAATSACWIDDTGKKSFGHAAIGEALVAVGGFWTGIGRLLQTPPMSWIARPVYRLVARFRHRLGGGGACTVR